MAKKISHAYIFKGHPLIATPLVCAFAQALFCPKNGCQICSICQATREEKYPDLHLLRASSESKTGIIKLSQIQDLIHKTALPPVQSSHQVFVIEEAENMNREASNALLKTLEEPLSSSIIILVTTSATTLLPTIRSRAQQITLQLPLIPPVSENTFVTLETLLRIHSEQERIVLCEQMSTGHLPELILQFQFLQQAHWKVMKERASQNGLTDRDRNLLQLYDHTLTNLNGRANTKLTLELFFIDFMQLNNAQS